MGSRLIRHDYTDDGGVEVFRLTLEIPEAAAREAISLPTLEDAIRHMVLTFGLRGVALDVSEALDPAPSGGTE